MEMNDTRRYDRWAWVLLAGIGLFRLFLATRYPLIPDECYYWQWSKHPDWCYFSKGPLVAWTIWLGTHVFGDTVAGIRVPAVLLHVGTGALLYRLARRLFDARVAFWTVLTALTVPLFAVGGILMTIDALSVALWAAAAWAAWRAWEEDRWTHWLLAGAFIGLGFLAKFTNAVQGVCVGLFLACAAGGLARFRSVKPWAAGSVALALTTPFWWWNRVHGSVTLGHLKHRGALDEPFRLSAGEFASFLGLQAVVMSPLLWAGLWIAAVAVAMRTWRERPPREVFLLAMFLPLFGFFAAFAWNDAGQPNWTVPGYLTAILLAVAWWIERARVSRAARGFAVAALGLSLLLTVLLHDTRALPLEPKTDPLTRLRGGAQLAQLVRAEATRLGARLVLTHHYGVAAQLRWEWRNDPGAPAVYPARNPERISNQFDLWPAYDVVPGQTVLYVTTRPSNRGPLDKLSRDIRKIAPAHVRAQFETMEVAGVPFWLQDGTKRVEVYQFVKAEPRR
jgi:4-amino-4-deoxy-L-arabinose transferase-like glycosyltransferase